MESKFDKLPYSFRLFDSLEASKDLWDFVPAPSVLLGSEYLLSLERFAPDAMKFRYVLAYKEDALIACFYFQLMPFKASERLRMASAPRKSFFSCFYQQLKKIVAKQVDFVGLINGNLLATGPYGMKSLPTVSFNELQIILDQLLKALFERNEEIEHASLCLIKELPVLKSFEVSETKTLSYLHSFCIQPSMILNLSSEWHNLEDYLNALQSKYRLRIKKAFHAAEDLVHKEFDLDLLTQHQDTIYKLYFNTADGSDFNLVNLHKEYFLNIKKALGDRYRLFGFFKDHELIAFYSFMNDGDELLGHFLGTMPENNLRYQVYFNILLKFIDFGIHGNFKRINLARTAIEIKSSVGAVPVEMVCYLTHRNKIANRLVPNLVQYLKPEEAYTIRNPFKRTKEKTISS
ncbi:MAG: GNAT family N-acetyltransferase [Saprospiraceae bacterium]|nr:GNAT family N-acetyltransferase [Saprospiraceae bacterium]